MHVRTHLAKAENESDVLISDEFAHRKRPRADVQDASPSKNEGDHHSVVRSKSQPGPSDVAEGYLLPPESSGAWTASPNSEEFYSPLEEKPRIDFGDLSWTEGSRDTLEATEDEDLMVTDPHGSTSRNSHDLVSETSLPRNRLKTDNQTASNQDDNADTVFVLHIDDHTRSLASDPALNSPATSRSIPSRARFRGRPYSHRNPRSEFRIPDLDVKFFESDFYRRFHTQSTSARKQ